MGAMVKYAGVPTEVISLPAEQMGNPVLVVDNVHIIYRVIGTKKQGAKTATQPSLVQKVLNKARGTASKVTEVHAVRGISFVAYHGESIGLIGVNGSGKSTLLRAVAGLIPPVAGSVWAAGNPALLGVNAALMPTLTGERNIYLGGLALGMTTKQVEEQFDAIVDFADIGEFVYLPMSTYSSGMAARLRFAISTIASPDILMIDEALATGDAAFKQRSKERIAELRRNAGTIFLVSHDIDNIRTMTNRSLWVHQGKLIMDGPTPAVCDEYEAYTKRYQQYRREIAKYRKSHPKEPLPNTSSIRIVGN